ncbi:hypothetical protein [Nodosilinea sp. E11]|uniref:hypothetical protein n=1 Tax=Nodosilinea sp. E11 TaxID=3037479 RepID=UPI0029341C5A|nr:hypothetical protein [Nodosilinea sp. E11]WOD37083.1 hypothetical protein RRF56_01085 [Nodosilinea sp. E11]
MPRQPQRSLQTRSAKTHPSSEALAPRPFATPTPGEVEARSPETQPLEGSLPTFSIFAEGGRLLPLQPKLTIGAPNDKYEQEADRVAKEVVQRLSFSGGSPSAQDPDQPPHPNQTLQRETCPTKKTSFR